MENILTVDVEDWFQAIENIPYEDWHRFESRIVKNACRLLNIFKKYSVKATFFILGYEAERHPDLVRQIFEDGHEIATHGYSHRFVYRIRPHDFRRELRISVDILESIVKQKIMGHRAPAWSITMDALWALDIILEEGLIYDSSISPWKSYLFGLPNSPRFPYIIRKTGDRFLYEFPMPTTRFLNNNIPFVGGFFTRLLPYTLIQSCMKKINNSGHGVMVWLHPWDLDVGQPRLKLPWRLRRHYYNLGSTEAKLCCLLRDFKFSPIRDFLNV